MICILDKTHKVHGINAKTSKVLSVDEAVSCLLPGQWGPQGGQGGLRGEEGAKKAPKPFKSGENRLELSLEAT